MAWTALSAATAPWPVPANPAELASYPPVPGATAAATVTLSGAGDIADCDSDRDEATAALLDELPGFVFTTGDNAYESGSPSDFARCYDPSWGRHRERTIPALGNHDARTARAAGYFGYFGERAGDPRAGWYALALGSWRVIVLNSACDLVGGCGPTSPQGRWLAEELAANRAGCTLALWHTPRFSTGEHGPTPAVAPFWDVLHAAGAELVVNGHEHSYERFVPLDPVGRPDPDRGLRQLVVGTGGGDLRGFPREDPNSAVRASAHGVLRLDVREDGYDWMFVPVDGESFTDGGTGTCH